ncbi:MAG: DNA repair protein RecN [Eubacterium sp.]|nr:DNA repair protein RecN [Eubacterium sp.]
MLINLHIVNLALIDELDIDFTEGLNIMTGETGAGKSIIIGSIGIGLGGKFDSSLLRNKDKDGMVELLFSVDERLTASLAEEEVDIDDGELLISRRLTGGKTVNRINDKNVTLAKLKRVSEKLLSLHAQHEQRSLLVASKHLELVDNFSQEIKELKKEVSQSCKDYRSISDKLEELTMDQTERAKRLDYIEYEINDIESARLRPGEDEELEDIYKKASNAQNIAEITSKTEMLAGYDRENSAGSLISEALHELQSLSRYDSGAEELISSLTDIDSLMSDFSRQLSDYISDMEFDEEVLRETETRLNLINTLKSRYGQSIEEIFEVLEKLKKEEEELSSYDETVADLEKRKIVLADEYYAKAEKLSKLRKKTAKALCKTISAAMKELNFNDVRFDMEFERQDAILPGGIDLGQFIISTNVGEDMRPLISVASGGELSRVMLAIKSVISETTDTPTLIFDEIDVGISGITAEKVGQTMRKIAQSRQLISITHLPQIAAFADTAYVIEKEVNGDKTITGIRKLDMEGRVMELARLLGGTNISDTVLANAREMLERHGGLDTND